MAEIRDVRESKNLSQTAVAEACGLSFSVYERIEIGSPRTTEAEIKGVLAVLRSMKKQDKKLGGRPFNDPVKQAAVVAARAKGESVAELLYGTGTKEAAPKAAPAKRTRKAATK